mgnify:CR=1 FL=1
MLTTKERLQVKRVKDFLLQAVQKLEYAESGWDFESKEFDQLAYEALRLATIGIKHLREDLLYLKGR